MSKRLLFDFECPVHGQFEDLVKVSTKTLPCPQCSRTSARLFPAPRIDMIGMATGEGATPTAIDHFDRIHRERRAIEEKRFAEHGDYGPMPGSDGGKGHPIAGGTLSHEVA